MKKMVKKSPDKAIDIETFLLHENKDISVIKNKLVNPFKT
jgi:hypothetical protein